MLTPKKLFRLFFRSVLLVFLIVLAHFSIRTPSFASIKHKVLCVGDFLVSSPADADGLVMQNDILPSQWKPLDSNIPANLIDRRIFFHETSGKADLNWQQCCAVESAAKHNHDRLVQLFLRPRSTAGSDESSSPFPSTSTFYSPPWLEVLSQYPNVAAILVNEDHYFAGSPLQDWYEKGQWLKSPYQVAHLSDYIRILTLNKGGGLYLDTDILTLKAYQGDHFRNCLSYDSSDMGVISNGVMHLERGHWLTIQMMRLMAEEYDPSEMVFHGSQAVSFLMHSSCAIIQGDPSSNTCKDINLLSSNFFFLIERPFSDVLYDKLSNSTNDILSQIKRSYGVHLWNSEKANRQRPFLATDSDSILGALAQIHCPLTVAKASQFHS